TAEGLIRERDRQLLAVGVGHHAGELAGLRPLLRRLLRQRLAQKRFRQLDRTTRERLGDHRVVVDGHQRERVRSTCRLFQRWSKGSRPSARRAWTSTIIGAWE